MKQAVLITWFSAVISLAISSLAVAELTPYSLAITFPGSETVEIRILLTAEPGGERLSVEPDLIRLPTPDLTGECVPTTSQASEAVPLVCLQPEPAEPASSFRLWGESSQVVQYRLTARPANTYSGSSESITVSRSDIPHLIRLLSLFGCERERLASLQSSAPAYTYKRDNRRTLKSPLFWCFCGLCNGALAGIFGSFIVSTGSAVWGAGFAGNPLCSFCLFGVWHHRSFLPQWSLSLTVPVSNEMSEENRDHIRRMTSNLIERGRAQLTSLEIDSTDQESESRQIRLEFRVYLPDNIQTEVDAINYLGLPESLENISISREEGAEV